MEYHLRVPRDPLKNIKFRRSILKQARGNPKVQAALREMCRRDIFFFFDVFCWQQNPKKVGKEVGPWITWDYQKKAVKETLKRTLEDQDDILWEKSREMGATWLALKMDVHGSLFHRNRRYLHISHSEKAVDDKQSKGTLFEKIRFIHKYLPSWMLRKTTSSKLLIDYPDTSSQISGAATTGRSGVGDRATKVLLDEFSKQQAATDILGQTADTGPRLFIGTHYGVGTEFYNLTQRPDMKKIVMHWIQHPDKNKGLYRYNAAKNEIELLHYDLETGTVKPGNTFEYPPDFKFVYSEAPLGGPFPGIRSPWYDKECARRKNPRDIAMHLDIDPQGSQSQFFNPLTVRRLVELHAREPEWEGDLAYDADTGIPLALTRREGGMIKLWIRPIGHPSLPKGFLPRGIYAAGCDVSAGTGATNSVASFGDAVTGLKVCEIATPHLRPEQFAPLVVAMCRMLLDEEDVPAKLCWETPGPGQTFGDVVLKLNYRNIYYREPVGGTYSVKMTANPVPGWHNNNQHSLTLFEHYRGALESQQFINRSIQALEETLKYRYSPTGVEHPEKCKSNDPSGARVNHGDRVMGDALLWKMMRQLSVSQEAAKIAEPEQVPHGSLAWRRMKRPQEKRDEWDD